MPMHKARRAIPKRARMEFYYAVYAYLTRATARDTPPGLGLMTVAAAGVWVLILPSLPLVA